MNTNRVDNPKWSTSAFGTSADTTPMELSARWLAMHSVAERVHGFAASRFMTTLALAALLLAAIAFLY